MLQNEAALFALESCTHSKAEAMGHKSCTDLDELCGPGCMQSRWVDLGVVEGCKGVR